MVDLHALNGPTRQIPGTQHSREAIPNAEFFAPWYREPIPVSMPREVYDTLSEHGKRLCRYIVADSATSLVTGWRRDLGNKRIGARAKTR